MVVAAVAVVLVVVVMVVVWWCFWCLPQSSPRRVHAVPLEALHEGCSFSKRESSVHTSTRDRAGKGAPAWL